MHGSPMNSLAGFGVCKTASQTPHWWQELEPTPAMSSFHSIADASLVAGQGLGPTGAISCFWSVAAAAFRLVQLVVCSTAVDDPGSVFTVHVAAVPLKFVSCVECLLRHTKNFLLSYKFGTSVCSRALDPRAWQVSFNSPSVGVLFKASRVAQAVC